MINNEFFFINSLIALISLILFIIWSKKDALLGFRAWSLLMFIIHITYLVGKNIGLKAEDIALIYFLEMLTTLFTILRLYFIIKAYNLELKEREEVNPLKKLLKIFKRAIKEPKKPKKINNNDKILKARLIKFLF